MGKITLHILHCGKIGVAPELTHNGQFRYQAAVSGALLPEQNRLWLPVSAYLIEHPRGLILVDTGWPRAISPNGVFDRKAQIQTLGLPLYQVCHGVVGPGETIAEQLAQRGIRPADLDYVLISHLDTEHVGGVSSLRGAKRILVSEEDYFWSGRTNFRFARPVWLNEALETFWFRVTMIGPENHSCDLFGDDSVQLVHIPGHTEGIFATLIRSGSKYVLLNSDGAFSPKSWETMTVPGMAENSARHRKSLQWIRDMSMSPDCIASLCSHDPDVQPQTIVF